MKKDLIFVLLFWIILGSGAVYFYTSTNKNIYIKQDKNEKVIKDTNLTSKLTNLSKEFKIIAKWKTYSQLIKDKKYHDWVLKINNLIEQYKKNNKDYMVNYIYYNFIANNVLKNLTNFSDFDKDLIIQSIRRMDFNNLTDKNYNMQLMKDYVDVTYYKPILKEVNKIDKDKLNTDNTYFYKVMLDSKTGIFYRIFKNRYDWNKTWIWFKPEFLENQFVDFLSQRFEQVLSKIWYNKEWFRKRVFSYYNINSLKNLAKLINKDFQDMKVKYNLAKLWIPTDRFFRQDERRYLFKNGGLENDIYKKLKDKLKDFKKDIKEYRLKVYLLSYLWKDENLFNDKVRAKFINPWEWWGIQNLFRTWRFVDEIKKLDLKPKIK